MKIYTPVFIEVIVYLLFYYYYYFFLLYNIVLVLPYINMHLPQVYTCSLSLWVIPVHQPQASCILHRICRLLQVLCIFQECQFFPILSTKYLSISLCLLQFISTLSHSFLSIYLLPHLDLYLGVLFFVYCNFKWDCFLNFCFCQFIVCKNATHFLY